MKACFLQGVVLTLTSGTRDFTFTTIELSAASSFRAIGINDRGHIVAASSCSNRICA